MTHSKLLSYYKIILMRNAETFADRILFSSGKNLFGAISHKITKSISIFLPARQLGHYFQPYRHIVLCVLSMCLEQFTTYYLNKTINLIKQQFEKDLLSTSSLAEVVMPWISQVYLPMSDMVGL